MSASKHGSTAYGFAKLFTLGASFVEGFLVVGLVALAGGFVPWLFRTTLFWELVITMLFVMAVWMVVASAVAIGEME